MKLAVVTGNPHKAREVAASLEGIVEVEHIPLDCPEHRHPDVCEIARGKAFFAYETLRRPLIVDDTAFCIEALNDFPGPYAAYVLETLGNAGILKLLEGVTHRNARFITAIAYADEEGIRVFSGVVEGRIVLPRGEGGFGYDPIFEFQGRTFAEIPLSEKSAISHRARALAAFATWFQEKHLATDRRVK